jgi:hypothetical protein
MDAIELIIDQRFSNYLWNYLVKDPILHFIKVLKWAGWFDIIKLK